MNLKRLAPFLFVLAVFVSLLLFYTAYDKQSKSLSAEKLANVLSFRDVSSSLRELNKVFALEAIGVISVVFLLGPLSKLFPGIFARFLPMRKPAGLAGFALALVHGIYSLVVFYNLDISLMIFRNQKLIGFIPAVLALIIFGIMSFTSTKQAVIKIGYRKWKAVQTFGYAGLLFALVHFFVIESKPIAGLDVKPFGLLFFYVAALALLLRLLIIFARVPGRGSYEEHLGEKKRSKI
ncbi:MAG: ferric reductase-like transmembrane domain-containing protein [archaeon]